MHTGTQDYLTKPFSPEELQVRLGNLLTLHCTRQLLQEELTSSQQNIESLVHALTTSQHDLEAMNSELRHMNKQQSNFIAVVTSKHTLIYHLDDALPLVQGDRDQLIQVVSNLLSNAVKYSPTGGEILLSSQREQHAIQSGD